MVTAVTLQAGAAVPAATTARESMRARFPARCVPAAWPATLQPRAAAGERLTCPPFVLDDVKRPTPRSANGPPRSPTPDCAPRSWTASPTAATSSRPAPALSAPLASHRSCQLWPGCAASQSSSMASPRTRRCWRLTSSSTNGGPVSRSPAAARGCKVAGQAAGTRRAGKRARIDSRAVVAAGSAAPACLVTAVTMRRCRTAHRASRAGNRAPGPAGPARLPAGSARHDGPAAAGSRLPAAGSCRSASW